MVKWFIYKNMGVISTVYRMKYIRVVEGLNKIKGLVIHPMCVIDE